MGTVGAGLEVARTAAGGGVQLAIQEGSVIQDARKDFNGDGRDDILWRNDTGLIDWLGEADGGFADNYANSVANIPTTWHVQAPELL